MENFIIYLFAFVFAINVLIFFVLLIVKFISNKKEKLEKRYYDKYMDELNIFLSFADNHKFAAPKRGLKKKYFIGC